MRRKDEVKEKAVIEATINVVQEVGFASASISKIAKEAGVSVATIYIYHEDKNDLMINTYYHVKTTIINAYFKDVDNADGVKNKLKLVWSNIISFGSEITELLSFSNQFANSPFYDLLDLDKIAEFAKPSMDILQEGVESGVLKDLDFVVFSSFFNLPAMYLSNPKLCAGFSAEKEKVDEAFELAWSVVSK